MLAASRKPGQRAGCERTCQIRTTSPISSKIKFLRLLRRAITRAGSVPGRGCDFAVPIADSPASFMKIIHLDGVLRQLALAPRWQSQPNWLARPLTRGRPERLALRTLRGFLV